MGYAYYEIPTPEGRMMKRGYGVSCKCHKRGCTERIDRGLGFLCAYCTWYFCGKHLTVALGKDGGILASDCFAGQSSQVCENCAKIMEKDDE